MALENTIGLFACAFALLLLSRQREPDIWDVAAIGLVVAMLIFGEGGIV